MNGAIEPGDGKNEDTRGKASRSVVGALSGLLHSSTIERRILILLLILGSLYTIYFARGLLLPIVLALIISSLLLPLVKLLNRIRIPDAIAAVIVLISATAAILALSRVVAEPASNWFERTPYLATQLNYKLRTLKESLKQAKEATQKIEKMTDIGESEGNNDEQKVKVEGVTLSEKILSQTQSVALMLAIMYVLVYFLLARGRSTLMRMATVQDGRTSRIWSNVISDVQQEVARYLFNITLINISLGALTALSMWLLEMPSPVLWGVVSAVLNYVPYLGGILTTVIIGMVSLLTFTSWEQIVIPPLVFAFFTAMEGQFITPMIVGRQLKLNPIAVVLSLLFWGWVWGIGGMIIAVPILAAIKIVSTHFDSMKTIRAIIG